MAVQRISVEPTHVLQPYGVVFLHKNREMLSRLVAVLMVVLALQCVKDLFFIGTETESNSNLKMARKIISGIRK